MKDRRTLAWVALLFFGSVALGLAGAVMPGKYQVAEWDTAYPAKSGEHALQDTVQTVLRAEMLRVHACYYEVLMMAPWRIDVEFWDLEDDILARTGANPPYFNALVRYDLELLATMTPAENRSTVIHEMFHIASWSLGLLAEASAETRTEYDHALDLQEELATRVEMWAPLVAACAE